MAPPERATLKAMKNNDSPTVATEAQETWKSEITLKVRDADLTINGCPNGDTLVSIAVQTVPLRFPDAFHDGYEAEMKRHGFSEIEAEEFMEGLFSSITKASQMKVLKTMLVG